jgi:acyl-CoA thioesterase FadM
MAEASLAAELGLIETLRTGGFARRYDVRYARELRAGAAFHLESAAIGADEHGVRFGHRFVDSVTGEAITWFDVCWEGIAAPAGFVQRVAAWDGPEFEMRADPKDLTKLTPTSAGRIQPGDLDEFGRVGICGLIHKFTDSSVQIGAAIGLTADYIKTGRRGFSTFEFRVRFAGALHLGDRYETRTGIAHLGNSSLRFLHVMREPASGHEIARLGQFGVTLDLDKRRPAALAPELRERAERLVLPTKSLGSRAKRAQKRRDGAACRGGQHLRLGLDEAEQPLQVDFPTHQRGELAGGEPCVGDVECAGFGGAAEKAFELHAHALWTRLPENLGQHRKARDFANDDAVDRDHVRRQQQAQETLGNRGE